MRVDLVEQAGCIARDSSFASAGVEVELGPREVGVAVVEAAGGAGRAGVGVDRLQRGAIQRLLGDAGAVGPCLVG